MLVDTFLWLRAALEDVADWLRPQYRPRRVVVPDFRGLRASERSEVAVKAGIRTRCISASLNPMGDGLIVDQDVAPGEKVRRDSEVVLLVVYES